jgi:hypothetical protein
LKIEDYVLAEIQDRMEINLEENKAAADQELAKLIDEEMQQLITYNHYYSDNIQKSRLLEVKQLMRNTVQKVSARPPPTNAFGTPGPKEAVINMSPDTLINSLHGNLIVDMDERACSEALVDLDAYYKV